MWRKRTLTVSRVTESVFSRHSVCMLERSELNWVSDQDGGYRTPKFQRCWFLTEECR